MARAARIAVVRRGATAWLQSVDGPWTRDAAALARMQAQSEGTVGLVVDSAARTATTTQLARLGGTLPPVGTRFDGMSGEAGRFRANVQTAWGGTSNTHICRLVDPRSLPCRMQIGTTGGWDATFIRPGA